MIAPRSTGTGMLRIGAFTCWMDSRIQVESFPRPRRGMESSQELMWSSDLHNKSERAGILIARP